MENQIEQTQDKSKYPFEFYDLSNEENTIIAVSKEQFKTKEEALDMANRVMYEISGLSDYFGEEAEDFDVDENYIVFETYQTPYGPVKGWHIRDFINPVVSDYPVWVFMG